MRAMRNGESRTRQKARGGREGGREEMPSYGNEFGGQKAEIHGKQERRGEA